MHKTPLNAWHHVRGGRMVDFAGWEMPVQYTSIVDEHTAVRQRAGLFDISHMGRLEFHGPGAEAFLSNVLTNDIGRLTTGDIRYSLVCRHDGGILDDVLIYRLPGRWLLVVNASNREKIINWIRPLEGFAATGFIDTTFETGMIAVQGPQAVAVAESVLNVNIRALKYYSGIDSVYQDSPAFVSRTGYTGEDGCEVTVPAALTTALWEALLNAGASAGIIPAGLGCRDTLRLEAAMPLYGHELSESIDPLTAGLKFGVRLNKPAFIGREALQSINAAGPKLARVGLELEGRRIAREESSVLIDSQIVGRVTSGTFSPTLQKVIAMAYIPPSAATPGTSVTVDLRGTPVPARVVELPFYKRAN